MDAQAGAYTLAARKHDTQRMHRLYVGYLLHLQIRRTQLLIKLIILVCQGIVSCLLRTDGAWKKVKVTQQLCHNTCLGLKHTHSHAHTHTHAHAKSPNTGLPS